MHYDKGGHYCYTCDVLPAFERGAFWLFASVLCGSLFLSDQPWVVELVLVPQQWIHSGQYWTPLSAPFVVSSPPLTAILTTLFVQWFLGSRLENFWGSKKYLFMVLTSACLGEVLILLAGLTYPPLAGQVYAGALPINAATTFAFGVTFARQIFHPMGNTKLDGRTLSLIVGGVLIAATWLNTRSPWPLLPALGAALIAAIFVFQPWRNQRGTKKRKLSNSSHLRVVRRADDLLN